MIWIEDDYKILLDALDSSLVGSLRYRAYRQGRYGCRQDTQNIQASDQARSLQRYNHVRRLDSDGRGIIDFPGIVTMLRDTGYAGWIMIQEESPEADAVPNIATTKNGEYLRQSLLPIV